MASLTPGVLVKLLENIDSAEKISGDHRSTVLQVIGIVPSISNGSELWPDGGFFLEISDSSHSTYVSLPEHDHDLVLSDKLRLGQFIYVDRISPGSPVPVLIGLRPISGRYPCVGYPKDLMQIVPLDAPSFPPSPSRRPVGDRVLPKPSILIKEEKASVPSRYLQSVRENKKQPGISGPVVEKKKQMMKIREKEEDDGCEVTASSASSVKPPVSSPMMAYLIERYKKRTQESSSSWHSK